jgi:Iron-containing redox enzyme
MTNLDELRAEVNTSIGSFFQSNAFLDAIDDRSLTRIHYARLLQNLFHQVELGAISLARAAVNSTNEATAMRSFLLSHAAEEATHTNWARQDLIALEPEYGEPTKRSPSHSAMMFVSFNDFLSTNFPFARLATSAVLESLASRSNSKGRIMKLAYLGLTEEHCRFILGHSDADPAHEEKVWEVISTLKLDDTQWGWMKYAARTGGRLYKAMFEEPLSY